MKTGPRTDIPELFGLGRPVFSFEFFLPKSPDDLGGFLAEVRKLGELGPDYVTLTYGAGGSARDRTIDTVGRLQQETGLPAACHLTGIAHTKAEVSAALDRLEAMGIRHLVALRGDAPKDAPVKPVGERDFGYAADLVRFVKARGGFRMAVAAYPEKHPEAASADSDLAAFAAKVREGADWAMTQLFFDAKDYFAFVARARAAGVSLPIVPGIMPVTGYAQLKRFTALCGTRIPAEMETELARIQADPDAVVRYGIDWAVSQCRALLAGGAPGVHFYTLNKSRSTAEVLKRLRA